MRPGHIQKDFLVSFIFGRNAVFKTLNSQTNFIKYRELMIFLKALKFLAFNFLCHFNTYTS